MLKKTQESRLRIERKKRGWTQLELAYRAKVALGDLSRIETGRMEPYPGQAVRLAAVLGLRPEQITERVDV